MHTILALCQCTQVNIRSSGPARLAAVAGFEGATRRSKPQLSIGSVLLVRISHLSPLLGADVTCCSSNCSKPWTSNEKVLGELRGGIIIEVPIPFALRYAENLPLLCVLRYWYCCRTCCAGCHPHPYSRCLADQTARSSELHSS